MRILHIHNKYQFRGGEETSAASERRMLEAHGHEVIACDRDNLEIAAFGPVQRAALFATSTWDPKPMRDVKRLIDKHRPEVAHVHNIQPLISPSTYWALGRAQVPVVQTLDNFRLYCPAATFIRDGKVCEECRQHSLLRSIRYRCYRNSYLQSLSVAQIIMGSSRSRDMGQKDRPLYCAD